MFVLGFSTVFIMLGASASWIGGLLRTELARQVELFGFSFNPITTVAGLIIIAMGLHFLGRVPHVLDLARGALPAQGASGRACSAPI